MPHITVVGFALVCWCANSATVPDGHGPRAGTFGLKEGHALALQSGKSARVSGSSAGARPLIVPACAASANATPPTNSMWLTLRDFQVALSSISAPAFIAAGTVLGLVRHCDPNPHGPGEVADDIDFALEHGWYTEHFNELADTLVAAGFAPKWYFPGARRFDGHGVPEAIVRGKGFEAAWTKRGVKVDLFSGDFNPETFVYALWTGGAFKYNGCTEKTTSLAPFKWHGVDVQVPVPLEAYLTHHYGNHYMKPQPWVWDVGPFKTGVCTRGRRRQLMDLELHRAHRQWLESEMGH